MFWNKKDDHKTILKQLENIWDVLNSYSEDISNLNAKVLKINAKLAVESREKRKEEPKDLMADIIEDLSKGKPIELSQELVDKLGFPIHSSTSSSEDRSTSSSEDRSTDRK